jgi:uncharacterized protein with HEPN domain
MRNDKEKLLNILEEIEKIEKYSQLGKTRFEQDELVQTWIIQRLQNIGENASKISDDFTLKYSDIPWYKIIAMRNIIVHEYFRVDLNEIWNTTTQNIPVFKLRIQEILNSLA